MTRFETPLLKHQQQAVDKLSKIKVGALYMEMGTGKTRTALELAYRRIDKGKVDKIIWLCPCDVKETIREEFLKHLGTRNPPEIVVCGIQSLSQSIRLYNVLDRICKKYKAFLVIDESNLVKNFFAVRTRNITRLSEQCKYKLILNGTPISRNEADLFAQWYILDWRILGYKSYYSFSANHLEYDENTRRVRRVLNTDYLAAKIEPYTFQCTKKEVLELKSKIYRNCYFDLTLDQEIEYERVKEMFLASVDEFDETTIYRMLNAMQLVVCGRSITSDVKQHMTSAPMFDKVEDNPRYKRLLSIVDDMPGKIIVYCKYVQEILDVTEALNKEYGEGTAITFYGGMNTKKRNAAIERFKNDVKIIVANKMCLGYGKNLQFCSTVIYYSNDWDLATREQSEDRVYRLGQEEDVDIYDICADNKLDIRILNCLHRKELLLDSFKHELSLLKEGI